MSLRSRLILLVSAVIFSPFVRLADDFLSRREGDEFLKDLPGAFTLGFYATAAVTSITLIGYHAHLHPKSSILARILTRHALLFLMIAGLSIDYALNDYHELHSHKMASYGLVVIVDVLSAIFITTIILIYRPGKGDDYPDGPWGYFAPIFPYYRGITGLNPLFEASAATVDFGMVILLMIAWIVMPTLSERERFPLMTRTTTLMLLTVFVYWIFSVVTNIVWKVLGLSAELQRFFNWVGSGFRVNLLQLCIALIVALVLFWCNTGKVQTSFAGPCS
jgi:hypothetical protein